MVSGSDPKQFGFLQRWSLELHPDRQTVGAFCDGYRNGWNTREIGTDGK
jgi:hypothetical protein